MEWRGIWTTFNNSATQALEQLDEVEFIPSNAAGVEFSGDLGQDYWDDFEAIAVDEARRSQVTLESEAPKTRFRSSSARLATAGLAKQINRATRRSSPAPPELA